MSLSDLELILPTEDLKSGDANLPVHRGADGEAEAALADWEAETLAGLMQSDAAE